jgi:steroid 5-alpha reductase family enzyme
MSDSNVLIVILAFGFTATNGYLNAKDLLAENANSNILVFIVGMVLFVYGFYINFESDSILIKLRLKSTPEKKYFIPNEGYFRYVASANYFGEIVEWFGFYLMCMNTASLVFLIGTLSNLVPRARQTKLWYIQKFGDEYPKNRTAIFPYIF